MFSKEIKQTILSHSGFSYKQLKYVFTQKCPMSVFFLLFILERPILVFIRASNVCFYAIPFLSTMQYL